MGVVPTQGVVGVDEEEALLRSDKRGALFDADAKGKAKSVKANDESLGLISASGLGLAVLVIVLLLAYPLGAQPAPGSHAASCV
jgi:hypothetical protein